MCALRDETEVFPDFSELLLFHCCRKAVEMLILLELLFCYCC